MVHAHRPNPTRLAPSILAGDHADLASSLRTVEQTPTQWLHLDIMDGHFAPNLSFGPETVRQLRTRNKSLFFDVHLMLTKPASYLEAFAKAGADGITVHVEAEGDLAQTLEAIASLGLKAGVALNPGTSAEAAKPYLERVDLILVMTVWPGFGGQSFIPETLEKMKHLAQWREELEAGFRLEVDGGIDLQTGAQCAQAGVDTMVAGTSFFSAADRTAFVHSIEAL